MSKPKHSKFDKKEELIKPFLRTKDVNKMRSLLIDGIEVNKRRGIKGVTLLHTASTLEITRELLVYGADVSIKSRHYHQTALHYAAIYNKELTIMKELLKNGSDIMARDKELMTPLHYAITNNKDPGLALFLLANGAETNVIDIHGRTPLHYASMNDREPKLIRELLRKRASVHVRDVQGRTPLHYASINNNEVDGILELLKRGANASSRDAQGKTALHYCVMNNRKVTIVQELLRNGARVNTADNLGFTPLYLAADLEHRNLDIITELLEYGANIHLGRDEFWPFYRYCTPLDKALHQKDLECAKLLSKISLFKNFDNDCKKCINLDRYVEYPDHYELTYYVHECFCELVKMLTDKITSNITVYEFITKPMKTVKPLYPETNSIVGHILTNYPIYHDIILPPLQLCLGRADSLLRLVNVKVVSCTLIFNNDHYTVNEVALNYDCVRNVSEYLSNDDLKNLIAAFGENIID